MFGPVVSAHSGFHDGWGKRMVDTVDMVADGGKQWTLPNSELIPRKTLSTRRMEKKGCIQWPEKEGGAWLTNQLLHSGGWRGRLTEQRSSQNFLGNRQRSSRNLDATSYHSLQGTVFPFMVAGRCL